MKRYVLGAINRRHKQLGGIITVPAWAVMVPEVVCKDAQIVDAYARYFVDNGMLSHLALRHAELTVQRTYEQGYMEGLRECLARRSAEYAEMWPQLMKPTGAKLKGVPVVELVGFNPQVVQQMYVPFQNTGRAGLDYVKEMLADMGRAANG